MGILHMLHTTPMEAISQLDIQSPDHVSVITRDGKMTVSVTKDGASVTVSLPIRNTFDTTPRPPLQQAPELQPYRAMRVVKKSVDSTRTDSVRSRRDWQSPTTKLTEAQVREIKMMLADKELMSKFGSLTNAFNELGKAYSVSGATISNIARGVSWKHVTI